MIEIPAEHTYIADSIDGNSIIVCYDPSGFNYLYDGANFTEILDEDIPTTKGKKHDTGKLKVGMVFSYFSKALLAVAGVGTYGNEKYGYSFWDDNWNRVENCRERYFDALLRHLLAHIGGQELDEESGHSHLSHAAWNILALLELEQKGENEL